MESKLIYHMGCIKAHFAFNHKRIFYPTNVRVAKDAIDSKGFVKKSVPNSKNLNQQILTYKARLDDAIVVDLQTFGDVDIDRIKLELNRKFHGQSKLQPELIENYTHENKAMALFSEMLRMFLKNQPKMNRGLKWRYDLLLRVILDGDGDIICSRVTIPYLEKKLDAFREGVNANTGSTRFKNFKRFIRWCSESGYPLPKIEWKRLAKPTFKPDFVFLTDKRIDQLVAHRPGNDLQEKVRKIFLVLIYTGMRYSDYSSLTQADVINGYIDKVARKTNTRFKVPVHERIRDIVSDPPKMADAVFNQGVKELGKDLKWTETVRYQTDINKFSMIPFNEMLCSSVGRHTFATRALMNGIPHNVILGWCAWTNSSMLFYYSEKLKLNTTDWMAKLN